MGKNTKNFPRERQRKALTDTIPDRKKLVTESWEDEGTSFSFRFFRQIKNFGISGKNDVWMSGLLEQLCLMSSKNADELFADKNQKHALRMHPIDLYSGETALSEEDFKFIPVKFQPNPEDCPIMQFHISKANGRVIGFFNENHTVFYIVYLDPNHNAQFCAYSDYRVRKVEPCMSELDDLKIRLANHVRLQAALSEEAEEFLYSGDTATFCFDRELVDPLFRLLSDKTFTSKLEEFLLSEL